MNPNLLIFLKRSFYVLLFAGLIAVLYYSNIANLMGIDLSKIGGYLMYGFLGFMMVVMFGLIIGVMFRSIWTGIMNRVDSIILCCPDEKHDGVHIVAYHYNSGGESESFNTYFHYYLDQKGKLYLSKKVEKEGNEISKSIQHLSEQTHLQLVPDKQRAIRVGSYTDASNKAVDITLRLNRGEFHFRGYEGLLDYGFKVAYKVNDQTKWRVTI